VNVVVVRKGQAKTAIRKSFSHWKICFHYKNFFPPRTGKTECAKQIVQYLTATSLGQKKQTSSNFHLTNFQSTLHNLLTQFSPALDAFGNAATLTNFNSSRYGKVIELKFDPMGSIVTAQLATRTKPCVFSFHFCKLTFSCFFYSLYGQVSCCTATK